MDFSFIPIDLYTPIWYNIIFFISLIFFIILQTHDRSQVKYYRKTSSVWGYTLLLFTLLYIGLRPIHEKFVDMVTYAYMFDLTKGSSLTEVSTTFKDLGFFYFTKFFSENDIPKTIWFLACACLYIVPLYVVSKRWFEKSYWVLAFIAAVCSFSFWGYGVNGIRNGIATSLFFLGISSNKTIYKCIWFFIAFSFHNSVILPIIGYIISLFCNKPKIFVLIWAFCVPLSFMFGGLFQNLLVSVVTDERASYLSGADVDNFAFRWDFIVYSATGCISILYFLYVRHFKDNTYDSLAVTYLTSNALWILINQVNFSNRFAYLSWFLLPFVIVYPWIKGNYKLRHFSFVFLIYSSFTYMMFLIQ